MKIGISTNCECGDTLQETLQNIKAAGFLHIMLSVNDLAGETLLSISDFEQSLEAAKRFGFEITYVHFAYRSPFGCDASNLWKIGKENEKIIKDYIQQIKICEKYGVHVAVMHPTCAPRNCANELYSEQGIKSIKEILEATKNCNVKLAFENLNPLDNKYLSLLLDNIKDERLGFCYDSGHHNLYAPGTDFLESYGDRCYALHLHDNLMDAPDINTSERDLHLLPFDGKIDFEKVMRGIANSGYAGDIIMLELHRYLPQYLAYLPYQDFAPIDYLREAYSRGQKLAGMLEEYRGKNET